MDATLVWTAVGSAASVAAVGVGVIALVRGRRKASTGKEHVEAYLASRRPRAIPIPDTVVVGKVPRQAPAFQPRKELVTRLGESGPGVVVVRAMTGMRGVGKTQLAAAYARSRIDKGWRLVAWVNAEDSAAVLNGLAAVADALGISKPGVQLESVAEAVRNRLEADGERRLLVFDNTTDVDWLARFLPVAGQCQVIITSHQQEAGYLGAALTVRVFSEQEALAFLTQRTGRSDDAEARELAGELGFLPLALAQAAAMIAAESLDYSTYLARLRARPARDYLTRTTGEPYPHSVADTIVLALDAATGDDPTGLSRGLINLIALLSTAGVSKALLYVAGQLGLLQPYGRWRGRLRGIRRGFGRAVEPEHVDQALGRLASASLVTFSEDGSIVFAHRLTMRVVRERETQDASTAGPVAALLLWLVTRPLTEPWENRPAARDTVQQIMALHEHFAPSLGVQDMAVTQIMLRLRLWAISCLNQLGDSINQAVEYGQVLVADSEQVLDETDPLSHASRDQLASAYRNAGRLGEAIALFELNLADDERVKGQTHPDTLSSRNNLALAYQAAGRLDEAIPLFEQTLADLERVHGETHGYTVATRSNLALAYHDAGRLDEAIPLFERALADSEQVLGETHQNTLGYRSNLAATYRDAGRLDEAIPLLERSLTDHVRILGETHGYTVASRNNLARAYRNAGRLDEAIPLFERALADRERLLGPTHPDTLTSRIDLISAYEDAGRLVEAVRLRNRHEQGHS